ncbi:MAG TPA: T9SS type A sorting domain-containing protein [Ignavibacteria bacterium]|nr:T9SS type A sorting domain-containing protein [Ignavibacteria bacterium]
MDIGDIDGDNDLDLISSNYIGGTYSVFTNNGSGVFSNTPITLQASSAGSCITVLDIDNDGDMDLAGIDEVDDLLFIYKNQLVNVNSISNETPSSFNLHQNYPNPFNPVTRISYELRVTNYVSLKVFDVQGNEIMTLVSQNQNAGSYDVEFNGENLSSGMYFYRIETRNFTDTKRMILLK